MTTTRLLLVQARSPLHVGTGQSTAAVDLPIARDRATGLPLVPGSSLKGALRNRARATLDDKTLTTLFGPDTDHASEHAGALAFSDARLLLLPVRSVAGTFAWVTSPLLLASLARDASLVGLTLAAPPTVASVDAALVTTDTMLTLQVGGQQKVVLEDLDLTVARAGATNTALELSRLLFPTDTAWSDLFRRRLCVVHDDVMAFLATHATELVTRVSLDPDTGTAKKGQLWTEENLPAESILVGVVEELPTPRTRPKQDGDWFTQLARLLSSPVQLGGKATVGRGRCQLDLRGA